MHQPNRWLFFFSMDCQIKFIYQISLCVSEMPRVSTQENLGFTLSHLPCQAPSNIGLPSRRDHTISGRGCPVAAQRNRKKLSSTTTMGLFGTPDEQIKIKLVSDIHTTNVRLNMHEKCDKISSICDSA